MEVSDIMSFKSKEIDILNSGDIASQNLTVDKDGNTHYSLNIITDPDDLYDNNVGLTDPDADDDYRE